MKNTTIKGGTLVALFLFALSVPFNTSYAYRLPIYEQTKGLVKQGDETATIRLAYMLQHGIEIPQDSKQSLNLYKELVDKGIAVPQYHFINPDRVENPKKALSQAEKDAKFWSTNENAVAGDAESQYQICKMVLSQNIPDELKFDNFYQTKFDGKQKAFQECTRAAEQGHMKAAYQVARMYYDRPLPTTLDNTDSYFARDENSYWTRDMENTMYWLGKAAEKGHEEAKYMLAVLNVGNSEPNREPGRCFPVPSVVWVADPNYSYAAGYAGSGDNGRYTEIKGLSGAVLNVGNSEPNREPGRCIPDPNYSYAAGYAGSGDNGRYTEIKGLSGAVPLKTKKVDYSTCRITKEWRIEDFLDENKARALFQKAVDKGYTGLNILDQSMVDSTQK